MKRFLYRHQPKNNMWRWLEAGIGATLGMGAIGWLGAISHEPLLIAPFGASSVLLFSVPDSPLSQPANMIGGHILASTIALAMRMVLPPEWWAVALAVGVAITAMAALRLTHPPAGADPVVIFLSDPGWSFLVTPIITACLILVGIATLVHLLPPRTIYPLSLRNMLNETATVYLDEMEDDEMDDKEK